MTLVVLLSWLMIVSGVATFLALSSGFTAGYGRYTEMNGFLVPSRVAWIIQESPAFFIPLYYLFQTQTYYGRLLNLMMIFHYFNRTFIYPFKINSKAAGSPVKIVLAAVTFCIWNGYIQGNWNANYQKSFSESSWFSVISFFIGVLVFATGMIINQESDKILQNLRQPGESGYKIPKGGLFEYVSCANYFGEIIEWCGYAMAAHSLPAVAFAFFTISNVGPRAISHHKWYLKNFKEYPKERKALIPFIL